MHILEDEHLILVVLTLLQLAAVPKEERKQGEEVNSLELRMVEDEND